MPEVARHHSYFSIDIGHVNLCIGASLNFRTEANSYSK